MSAETSLRMNCAKDYYDYKQTLIIFWFLHFIIYLFFQSYQTSWWYQGEKCFFRIDWWPKTRRKSRFGNRNWRWNQHWHWSNWWWQWRWRRGNIVLSAKKVTHLGFGHFITISGHFFANYINIFHKIELLTIILICLTCLNLFWIKRYDIKHNFLFFAILKILILKIHGT